MNEEWRQIQGYEGLYEVSNLGRVKSLKRGKCNNEKLLKLREGNRGGYLVVILYKDKKRTTYNVHKLVAMTFIPNPENKPFIDHINTIRTDNRVENLRWVTERENANNELTKKHISESKKGHKVSEETKKKISTINKGRKLTDIQKNKLGESHKKKVVQLNKDTNELIKIWDSIKDAKIIGGFSSNISSCCKGKRKTSDGYKWMYYEDYMKIN